MTTVMYAAVLLLLAAVIWRTCRRSWRAATYWVIHVIAAAAPTPAVLDTEPGINLALLDECERLYSMPAYTGTDRRRNTIRNQQHKGDQ